MDRNNGSEGERSGGAPLLESERRMSKDKDLATILREEAALAESEEDCDDDGWVRSRRPPKAPSMVYSVRIPVSRVEELRRVAEAAGMEPSAMVRRWVLERLDTEQSEEGGTAEQVKEALVHLLAALRSRDDDRPWGLIVTPHAESFANMVAQARPSKVAKSSAKSTAVGDSRTARGSQSVATKGTPKAKGSTKAARRTG
jgi:hypothetical protein